MSRVSIIFGKMVVEKPKKKQKKTKNFWWNIDKNKWNNNNDKCSVTMNTIFKL